ncbi:MAG: DUF5689 domain-containing protein [Alistipes sp.]
MKNFSTKHIRLFCALLSTAFLLIGGGCSDDQTDPTTGARGVSSSVYLTAETGTRSIQVEANSAWQVRLAPDTKLWVSIDGADSGFENGSFTVTYKSNNDFPRKGTILVSSATAQVVDTVYLMQSGITPLCQLPDKDFACSSVGAADSVRLDTNVPQALTDALAVKITYDDPAVADWITKVSLNEALKNVTFTTQDNLAFTPRKARIEVMFTDAWGESYSSSCLVSQGIPGGTATTRELSMSELRGLISEAEGELKLTDDVAISGIVISDCESKNTAASPMIKLNTAADPTLSDRTAYLQTADGSLGIALVAADVNHNSLHRYDHLKLWCKDLTLIKRSNPERYQIEGFTADHVITKSGGTAADVPAKRRFIDQLTDNDLYTFVTLKRCQMAIRCNNFTPVNKGYDKFQNYYPSAVVDRHGNQIYLMTNIACTYRYDIMPSGEGTISGVLVHETFTQFEKDGDIGRYQIRNITREDIALADGDGFLAQAVEWAPNGSGKGVGNLREYAFPQYPHPATADGQAHALLASSGSGLSFHSNYGWLTWGGSYRKPGGGTLNSSAWGHDLWWDHKTDTGHSMMFEFSTKGLSSDHCWFAFAARLYSNQGGIRYWAAEYSLDGDTWTKFADFTIPDQSKWGKTRLDQIGGDKSICLSIPTEILGHNVAWIRLRAAQSKVGTLDSYDGATIPTNGKTAKAIVVSYAALRYNQ